MKIAYLFFTISVLLISACKRDIINNESDFLNQEISNTDTLIYILGSFGDEEGAWIVEQAKNYEISEIARDLNTSEINYFYKANSNFIGLDTVVIRSERGSNGESKNDDIIITTLYINVQ
tara:strand:- start:70 stop:429 length:360 start_codon:yes stop_codon:yes gene_type:complete